MNKLILDGKEFELDSDLANYLKDQLIKKPEKLTWEKIAGSYNSSFVIGARGELYRSDNYSHIRNGAYLPTEYLARKSAAINKLLTVAHYFRIYWKEPHEKFIEILGEETIKLALE